MVWLNASLAFTLAMIIFCTMVTAITEAIHHFFSMRQRGLERMLEQLFEQAIWPRVRPLLATAKDAVKKDFLDTLTANPAVEGKDGVRLWGLRTWFAPRQLDSLTLTQFAERLADTEVGKKIWSSGSDYAKPLVDDVARRFQRFEDGAIAYFAQRAQMLSLVVAILLAFALNVDAIRLFSAFLTDQQLAAGMLAEAEKITATYQKQQAQLSVTRTAPAEGQTEAQPTPATAPAPSPPSPGDQANLQAIGENAAFLRDQITASTVLGLPIGTVYYPWCLDERPGLTCKQPLSRSRLRETIVSSRFVGWLTAVLLAGVLIGLGGPFWFNAFSTLSALIQLLRRPDRQAKAGSTDVTGAATLPSVEVSQPRTAAEAFATAAAAGEAKPGQPRILLTPQGTPL
jgi:hypothetical protein